MYTGARFPRCLPLDTIHHMHDAEKQAHSLAQPPVTFDRELARLNEVFQQAPMFMAVLRGPQFVFELANDAYYQLVGRHELIGKPVFDALPDLRGQGFEELLQGVVQTGVPFVGRELPAMIVRTPGEPPEKRYVDFVYAVLLEADGTRSGIVAYGSDVTDHVEARHQVEKLLRESEQTREELAALNEELRQQQLELELTNQQLQDNTVQLEAQAEELQKTAAELEERTAEAEAARRAVAASERELRTLADAIPTLAWTARADGYIDWYNARWYEYTGTSPSQMAGWGWQSVHDPEALPRVLEEWRAAIQTGSPFEMTFPLRAANGKFRRFLTRVTPWRDADGKVIRWFGTNTDVEAERQARDAAEGSNLAKTNFLATMSHELRTPLNAIGGYAELLDLDIHGALTDEQRESIHRIQRSQRHLLGLINEILNYAKLGTGTVHFDAVDVPVCEAVSAAESLVAPQARVKGLEFVEGDCPSSLKARADAEKLRQILVNLMSNAVKFTNAGGRIETSCELQGGVVSIRVADNGIGIPADKLDTIFDPFIQVRADLTRPHEGTGLGLSISRDLARGMNGDLVVESTEGIGSTFTLTLPVA
jgi:PAS domain S-box-containing protein